MFRKGDEPIPGFRLVRLLGQGNYGAVWEARAPGETPIAMKLITLDGGRGAQELHAVQRVKNIRHAHLLPIHALWVLDDEGFPFPPELAEQGGKSPSLLVVSMLLGEKSLADRLAECRKADLPGIPPLELLQYMEDAARGIDFLNAPRHDLGRGPVALQHCDVKPQNILLLGDSAMICDFGLAHVLGIDRTAAGMPGSPAYISPECIDGKKPSRGTDQYSLAITYVELRTGLLPFPADSYPAVIAAHLEGRLDLSILPARERFVIARATARDPAARFPSAVAMVRALRKAVPPQVADPARDSVEMAWPQYEQSRLPILTDDSAIWVDDVKQPEPARSSVEIAEEDLPVLPIVFEDDDPWDVDSSMWIDVVSETNVDESTRATPPAAPPLRKRRGPPPDATADVLIRAGLLLLDASEGGRRIDVAGSLIEDDDLHYLADLTELEALILSRTKVGDAGLVHLKKLSRLSVLMLNGTRVTDEGMKSLQPLSALVTLILSDTVVTDDGLTPLAALTGLQTLFLMRTNVTASGIRQLERWLPGCDVCY